MNKFDLLRGLTNYIKPVIKITGKYDFWGSSKYGHRIYIEKLNYTIKDGLVDKTGERPTEDEIIDFMKREGVLDVFEGLFGKLGEHFYIKEPEKNDPFYKTFLVLEFENSYLNEVFRERIKLCVDVLDKGEKIMDNIGNCYRLESFPCYVYILLSDKLSCVYSEDLGINVCSGEYGEKLAGKPKWLEAFVYAISPAIIMYPTKAVLKVSELDKIYKEHIRPRLPDLTVQIAEKLEDNTIPQEILELGDWELIKENSKKLESIYSHIGCVCYFNLPNTDRFYEYDEYFIILLRASGIYKDENEMCQSYYYIAKRGKVLFVFSDTEVSPPTINLREGIISIPNNTNINNEIIINEIMKSGDTDIFF